MHKSGSYQKTERSIRRWILFSSLASLLLVALLVSILFLRETWVRFEEEKTQLRHSYMENQKTLLQSRVDNAIQIIDSYRQQARERVKSTLRSRVDQAYAIAHSIYENHSEQLSQEQIQKKIVESLRPFRWRDGNSYIWIDRFDHKSVLSPQNPYREGQNLGDITDCQGNYIIRDQGRIAQEEGAGFSHDYFYKPDAGDTLFAQISYVRDLELWDWYLGSAEFVDDFEEELQQEILQILADLRYDDNYLWIDRTDGYAILMNGQLQDPPLYNWELEDADGRKIIQEQLQVAQENPKGGFLTYIWHEEFLGEDKKYLSYVRLIPELGWKIGTGLYVSDLERELAKRESELWYRTWTNITTFGALILVALALVALLAIAINRRIRRLFTSMDHQLDKFYRELQETNAMLEERVVEETQRRLEHERMLIQQTKMAEMGNMIGLIAHQWQQPLNALSLNLEFLEDEYRHCQHGELETLEETVRRCDALIQHMSQTVDDFRNYFRPESVPQEFDVTATLHSAASILEHRMRQLSINLELPQDSVKIFGYHNEFKQVVLNLLANACDALEKKNIHNSKQEPCVQVALEQSEKNVCVEFCDNAGGIPASIINDIFTPYFSTKGNDGTGIGLYMSRRIIEERFNGSLSAINKDDGACLRIVIPQTKKASQGSQQRSNQRNAHIREKLNRW
ncbi:sensor histidine kinase [Desulfurispira natronophila]|uniref:histidine kinase n=1 Tax=Desulfurispira natronophila TaxID=682562 RepID=A0A7W7Y626_9BACT|nr:cache domain-containing protein [Desulfurispira natronophila]MBB5022599.1 signal transduction histidine kinase [Desulfurispira natronophila]